MPTSRYHVPRMDCAAEEQLVRMGLDEVAGVQRVEVDLGARQVLVDHEADRRRLDEAMSGLGLGAEHLGDQDTPEHDGTGGSDEEADGAERSALWIALLINAGFFVGELTVGLLSRSMGLVADALDMGADASVYALSLAAVGSIAARKRRLARASGWLQFGLALLGLAEVVRRVVVAGEAPDPTSMVVVSLLALAGNVAVLVLLRRIRSDEAHIEASWIFTANDVKVNLLVIAAAIGVASTGSALPDLLAGAAIFLVVANGARRILGLSRRPTTSA